MGDKLVPALLTLSIIVVAFALIAIGWRGKLKRQEGIAPLPAVPTELSEPSFTADGQYVVTTVGGDWLERIAVHGLGIRSNARLSVHGEGALFERSGGVGVFIPRDAIEEVGSRAGMAGKFVEKDGLVVISWRLGEQVVDTGFRTAEAEAKRPLIEALSELCPQSEADYSENRLSQAEISRKNIENE